MIRRVLPHPYLFLALIGMWLLLKQSLEPGTIAFGVLVAFGASWAMVALAPPPVRIHNLGAVARLAGRVFLDVFRSNLAVGRIILGGAERRTHAGFMTLKLDLKDRYGLAVLAVIMTCTPGTQWVHYDAARGILLLHVLDLVDESEWAELIKRRYETLLREIFE